MYRPSGKEGCPYLSNGEARTHFSAWCIVSAPLVLGFNFSDSATVDAHWDTVTNKDAIDVNQDWAGFSGSLFASSAEVSSFTDCTGPGMGSKAETCVFPTTQSWYKPLSGRDHRHSTMAVLLVNNGDAARDLSFTFRQVPGLEDPASSSFCIYDVWAGAEIEGNPVFGGYIAKAVAPHGNVFLKIASCR